MIQGCKKKKTDIYQEVYEVEMLGIWSASTHPTDFPSNAHFSPMVGLSHVTGLDVIRVGLSPTEGVKSMAETGKTDLLDKEFLKLHNQTYSLDRMIGKSFTSPGNNKAQIGVERGKHQVTILSMIAPSPDWFVAVTTSLLDPSDNEWYDEVIVHASVYDAGTDSGLSFKSADLPTDTIEGIHRITTGPLTEGMDTVKNIASFIFRRVK